MMRNLLKKIMLAILIIIAKYKIYTSAEFENNIINLLILFTNNFNH